MTIDISHSAAQLHAAATLDLSAVKKRQQATWASGNFGVIGVTLQIVGESLCEAADVRAGDLVLDVACGNGNASLAAARRWARVTGVDYVPDLLRSASARAQAEGLNVDFRPGDAEQLPFGEASVDVVLSTFGVMFTADQSRAARELLRVCRPGGRIGLANWTPEGFIGKLFQVVGRYVPPPPGLASPLRWGTESGLRALLDVSPRSMHVQRKYFMFRYSSPEHFIDVFRRFYGPTHQVFAALDLDAQEALTRDMAELLEEFNRAGSSSLVVPGEYLEVVIVR